MIGQFFGTRFFSPWQLYGTAGVFEAPTEESNSPQLKDPFADVLRFALDQQKMNFKELDASIAKLFTRYQSNVCQLKKALKQPGLVNVQRLYQKCLSDRQMYNYLISITDRSQLDMHPAVAVLNQNDQMNQSSMAQDWFGKEKPLDLSIKSSWRDATPSELRFVSVEFMSLANEVHYFLGLSQQAAQKAETVGN
ncbi:hypothetical protein M3Y97_00407500 [Aphelenchoides bicaudatus]|nr:hypothetical protein M3Y97_00407500 [Aphelenchoides bicaudatus]